MKEYYLFLDESKNTPPSVLFSLGGCAIEKQLYENKICPFIKKMKKEIFDDEDIILHETEIRIASKEIYKPMRKKEVRDKFWKYMGDVFDPNDITVFTAVINPDEYKNKYFEKMGDRYYKISDDIKKCVEFKKSNLLKDAYPQGCHLIVCRNVLIYFTEEAKKDVYEKFNKSLVTDGCLFVGNTEQIIGYKDMGYSYDHLFFYRKTN